MLEQSPTRQILEFLQLVPLLLEVHQPGTRPDEGKIATRGTGFFVTLDGQQHWLVTNWHVVVISPESWRRHGGGAQWMSIKIPQKDGTQKPWCLRLVDENFEPLWKLHPADHNRDPNTEPNIDIAAIPVDLKSLPEESHIRYLAPTNSENNVAVSVSQEVSIIGYPDGQTSGGRWPIWKTGNLATRPFMEHDHRPVCLIDATARQGMSGSPVIALALNGHSTTQGGTVTGGTAFRFVGIYAGRQVADNQQLRSIKMLSDLQKRKDLPQGIPDVLKAVQEVVEELESKERARLELGRVFHASAIWELIQAHSATQSTTTLVTSNLVFTKLSALHLKSPKNR